jgi:hypothetical protein
MATTRLMLVITAVITITVFGEIFMAGGFSLIVQGWFVPLLPLREPAT